MTAPLAAPRPGRGMVLAGIVLLVAGALLGIAGVVGGVLQVTDIHVDPVGESLSVTAEAGDELAVYRTSGSVEGGCSAVGPDGAPLGEARPFGTETVTVNGTAYTVHQVLTVRASGTQVVTCTGSGFAVGPRVQVFGLVGLILGGVFGGIALAGVGLVLLLVGLSRRRSSSPGPGGPGGPQWTGQAGPASPQWPGQAGPGSPQWPGQAGPGSPQWPGQAGPGSPQWPGQAGPGASPWSGGPTGGGWGPGGGQDSPPGRGGWPPGS